MAISRYGAAAPFPAGTALMVEFTLAGRRFQALNGGPDFTHSQAISLSISAKDAAEASGPRT
jgi:predicted 3-demethylubiquinone-9 3-methyltransferase (glyoxalase superfamily)